MRKQRVHYVDGFVLTIPKKRIAEYRKIARDAGKIWMKYGALGYKECRGDDLKPDTGGYSIFPFPKMIKAKPNETIWFSYIEYKSKKHRDAVNKRVTADMVKYQKDSPNHMANMPFEMKRMAYGGFKVEVEY